MITTQTKEYHVGVDVTYSTWVHVTATSQEEAEEMAKLQAEDTTSNAGAWVDSAVHFIDTVDEL
jgi:hypothetical protein